MHTSFTLTFTALITLFRNRIVILKHTWMLILYSDIFRYCSYAAVCVFFLICESVCLLQCGDTWTPEETEDVKKMIAAQELQADFYQ